MKQTPEFKQACLRLRANTDFKEFLKFIVDYGDRTNQQLIYEEDKLRTIQGKVQAVTEIIKAFDTAIIDK